MHTRSPLPPVAARTPFRHPTSPADTIYQHPPKSNADNWKALTAKGLLDLHANSSILASHRQTTGKMRLCTSFQMISCLFLHSTHTYTHTYTFSWFLLSWSQKSAGVCITCAFWKAGQESQGATRFCPLVRTGLQTATVDESLNVTAAQLIVGSRKRFLQVGLQLPHAFYARAYDAFLARVSHSIVEVLFRVSSLFSCSTTGVCPCFKSTNYFL